MHDVQGTVFEWLVILNNGSIAEKLFTYEELNNHIQEYSIQDINYIVDKIFPILLEAIKKAEDPEELLLLIASLMTKLKPYIHDDDVRRGVFIHASKLIRRFLRNHKHARIISDLMLAYQKEKGEDDGL